MQAALHGNNTILIQFSVFRFHLLQQTIVYVFFCFVFPYTNMWFVPSTVPLTGSIFIESFFLNMQQDV